MGAHLLASAGESGLFLKPVKGPLRPHCCRSTSAMWMSAFGGAATFVEFYGVGGVVDAVNNNYADGVFKTLAGFGMTPCSSP